MRKLLIFILLPLLVLPVWAQEPETDILQEALPPEAAELLEELQPDAGLDFWTQLKQVVLRALGGGRDTLNAALRLCAVLLAVAMLCAMVQMAKGELRVIAAAGALGICAVCLGDYQTMVRMATDTLQQMTDYTACYLPVMASAVALGGGITSSAALYSGTVLFSHLLMRLITSVLIPMVTFFLAVATAEAALDSEMLSELREFIGWLISKCLRVILYIFLGYMTLTGVISGASDATALKATKAAVSGMVPVVGGILSDASESLLVSAAVLKQSVGVFGMLAVIAICILPFFKIGVQYLMLKVTAAVCGTVGLRPHVQLMKHFSSAMGYLLAMSGTCALMQLISSVCLMKVMT